MLPKLQMPRLLSVLKGALQLSFIRPDAARPAMQQAQPEPSTACLPPGFCAVDKVLVPAGEAADVPPAWVLAGRLPNFGSLTAADISARAGPLPLVGTREHASWDGAASFVLNAPGLPVSEEIAGDKQTSCPSHLLLKCVQCSLLVQESTDSSSHGCRFSCRRPSVEPAEGCSTAFPQGRQTQFRPATQQAQLEPSTACLPPGSFLC